MLALIHLKSNISASTGQNLISAVVPLTSPKWMFSSHRVNRKMRGSSKRSFLSLHYLAEVLSVATHLDGSVLAESLEIEPLYVRN